MHMKKCELAIVVASNSFMYKEWHDDRKLLT